MVHRVTLGSTNYPIKHVAPVFVASATFAVERLDVDTSSPDRVLQLGPATINANTLSVDSDSGVSQPSARRINVDDPAVDVGEIVIIEALDGSAREHVTIAGKGAGYLIGEYPLASDYPGGAARVVRPTLAFTLDAAVAATVGYVERGTPLAVVWVYELAGARQIVRERLEIVRSTVSDAGDTDVQLALREAYPDLAERIPASAELGGFVRFARSQVERMLRSRSIDPAQLLAGDAGRDMVFWRCVVHLAENGHVPANRDPEVWLADAQRHYRDVVADVTRGAPGLDATELDNRDRAAPSKARHVFAQL